MIPIPKWSSLFVRPAKIQLTQTRKRPPTGALEMTVEVLFEIFTNIRETEILEERPEIEKYKIFKD